MIKKYSKNGFTLLEVIIAITILTVGIGGSYILIQQTLRGGHIVESKLLAYYLAQEGIETVRNIRDDNWLLQRSLNIDWDEGIYKKEDNDNICANGCEVDYFSRELVPISGEVRHLKIDSTNGLYSYSGDIETKFKRKITVSPLIEGDGSEGQILNITCEVYWQESGIPLKVQVEEKLYNWAQL